MREKTSASESPLVLFLDTGQLKWYEFFNSRSNHLLFCLCKFRDYLSRTRSVVADFFLSFSSLDLYISPPSLVQYLHFSKLAFLVFFLFRKQKNTKILKKCLQHHLWCFLAHETRTTCQYRALVAQVQSV